MIMAASQDHHLRTSPSTASIPLPHLLKYTTQPSEPPSPPPNSPLPALPSRLPYGIQKSATLGPPPRPPRPQTSLPNLKPRLIKSPERPSRPFSPLVVEQIRNAPAQPLHLPLSHATGTVDRCVTSKDKFATVQLSRSAISRQYAGIASGQELSRTTQGSQVLGEVVCLPSILGTPTEQWEKTSEHSFLEQQPSRSPTTQSLIRSPLHIPPNSHSPASQFSRRPSPQTENLNLRDTVYTSVTLESPIPDLDSSSSFAFKFSDRCSGESNFVRPSPGEAITSLPQIRDHPSDFKFQRETDFFSVAYSSTKDSPGPPPVVICSSTCTDNNHASSEATSMKEKAPECESTVRTEAPSSKSFSETYVYSDSSYPCSPRSRNASSNEILPANSASESLEEAQALSWCARHKNRLWILATVLLVFIATVSITGGIVAKLSLLGAGEKVKRINS